MNPTQVSPAVPFGLFHSLRFGGVVKEPRLILWFNVRGGVSDVPLEEYKRKAIAKVIAPLLM